MLILKLAFPAILVVISLGASDVVRADDPAIGAQRRDEKVSPPNTIDTSILRRLKEFGLTGSADQDDASYIRRAYLDVLGVLPSPIDVTKFVRDRDSGKRSKLAKQLSASAHQDIWKIKP